MEVNWWFNGSLVDFNGDWMGTEEVYNLWDYNMGI